MRFLVKKIFFVKKFGTRIEVNDFFENEYCQKRDIDLECENNKKILKLMNYLDESEDFLVNNNKDIISFLKLLTSVKNRYNMLLH